MNHAIESNKVPLQLTVNKQSPNTISIQIIAPTCIVDSLFEYIAQAQQPFLFAPGFMQGNIPVSYIKKEYKSAIVAYLKEFLLRHAVVNKLYNYLRTNKILMMQSPQLQSIFLDPGRDAIFTFLVPVFTNISIQDWKHFTFKSPRRKNYRDIDKQVETFVKEEQSESSHEKTIRQGDWVQFNVVIIDKNANPLIEYFDQSFWLCLSDQEVESNLQELFIGKHCNDTFVTNNPHLHEYSYTHVDQGFYYLITIQNVVHQAPFSFERFKKHFRLKTNKDMHKKLIEVFSFHNDLSQRHCMINEAFELLLQHHQFEAPKELVEQQQSLILSSIKLKPDYTVYKKEKNFHSYVQLLAERQVKESLFIDQFAYHENLQINNEDVCNYLSLTLRPRIKQFLHFHPPLTRRGGQEIPVSDEELKRSCLREKAINHAIHYLTKQ